MRPVRLFSGVEPQKWPARTRYAAGTSLAVLLVAGSMAVFPQRPLVGLTQSASASTTATDVSQGTLPLPTPGTPVTAPAPPSDVDAKAHAAMLAAKANIDITDAWTRAIPANATTATVYLQVVSGKDPDKLIDAEAPMAARVEIQDDGKPATAVAADIAGGATVSFSPQGRHLLLVGVKGPLTEGDSFLLTLKFDKAGTQSTSVKVLNANATSLPAAVSTRTGDTTATVSQR